MRPLSKDAGGGQETSILILVALWRKIKIYIFLCRAKVTSVFSILQFVSDACVPLRSYGC